VFDGEQVLLVVQVLPVPQTLKPQVFVWQMLPAVPHLFVVQSFNAMHLFGLQMFPPPPQPLTVFPLPHRFSVKHSFGLQLFWPVQKFGLHWFGPQLLSG
jgi:hypothetical protein